MGGFSPIRDGGRPSPGGSSPLRRAGYQAIPFVVWLGAVAGAMWFHSRVFGPIDVVAYVEPRTALLSSLDARRVGETLVELHDHVREGQMLVRLDDSPERLALERLSAELAEVRARLGEARSRLGIDAARRDLAAEDLERSLFLDRLTAQIDYLEQVATNAADRMLLAGAQVDLERIIGLFEQQQATPLELNAARTRVNELTARLEANTEVLARKNSDWVEVDRRWHAHTARRDATAEPAADEEPLAMIRLAVETKQQEIVTAARQLDRLVLRAPFDGQVTGVFAAAGANVQGGDALVRITAPTGARLVAYVPESRAMLPRVGARVRLERIGTRERSEGVVASIAHEIAELPLREAATRRTTEWARAVVIHADVLSFALPGEAYRVRFE